MGINLHIFPRPLTHKHKHMHFKFTLFYVYLLIHLYILLSIHLYVYVHAHINKYEIYICLNAQLIIHLLRVTVNLRLVCIFPTSA